MSIRIYSWKSELHLSRKSQNVFTVQHPSCNCCKNVNSDVKFKIQVTFVAKMSIRIHSWKSELHLSRKSQFGFVSPKSELQYQEILNPDYSLSSNPSWISSNSDYWITWLEIVGRLRDWKSLVAFFLDVKHKGCLIRCCNRALDGSLHQKRPLPDCSCQKGMPSDSVLRMHETRLPEARWWFCFHFKK